MSVAELEPLYVPKNEAARLLSCSERHLDHLEQADILKPIRHKRWVRYPLDELRALKNKLRPQG